MERMEEMEKWKSEWKNERMNGMIAQDHVRAPRHRESTGTLPLARCLFRPLEKKPS